MCLRFQRLNLLLLMSGASIVNKLALPMAQISAHPRASEKSIAAGLPCGPQPLQFSDAQISMAAQLNHPSFIMGMIKFLESQFGSRLGNQLVAEGMKSLGSQLTQFWLILPSKDPKTIARTIALHFASFGAINMTIHAVQQDGIRPGPEQVRVEFDWPLPTRRDLEVARQQMDIVIALFKVFVNAVNLNYAWTPQDVNGHASFTVSSGPVETEA